MTTRELYSFIGASGYEALGLLTKRRDWEQHVRRLHFHQVERPHWDRLLFTSRVSFL